MPDPNLGNTSSQRAHARATGPAKVRSKSRAGMLEVKGKSKMDQKRTESHSEWSSEARDGEQSQLVSVVGDPRATQPYFVLGAQGTPPPGGQRIPSPWRLRLDSVGDMKAINLSGLVWSISAARHSSANAAWETSKTGGMWIVTGIDASLHPACCLQTRTAPSDCLVRRVHAAGTQRCRAAAVEQLWPAPMPGKRSLTPPRRELPSQRQIVSLYHLNKWLTWWPKHVPA